MHSDAPGQFLGYAMQFPRAFYHLLKCDPGDSVCVEVIGDITTVKVDGSVLTEEAKSSILGNPLTNKSSDLWKTFHNWIKAVNAKELELEKTRFILYANQKGKNGIVNKFNDAVNSLEAKVAMDFAKEQLKTVTEKHEIWPYYNYCINVHHDILLKVIEKFELEIVVGGAGFKEVKKELEKMLVPVNQIDFLIDTIGGWIQKKLMILISEKKPSVIKRDDFSKQFLVIFERSRKRELIDFTLQDLPNKDDLKKMVRSRPCYVRQLDKIGISEDDILEAVGDFMRAKVNRDKWIELELIDEEVALDFENRLSQFWKNQKLRLDITQSALPPEKKGQLLYVDCKTRQETIRDMTPPSTAIAGTYHALADGLVIGWHSDWEKDFII